MITKHKNDELLTRYLDATESLEWVGQPGRWNLIGWGDLFAIPFAFIWCGVASAFVFSGLTNGNPLFLLLPHFWIGFWLFPGRFIWEYFSRRSTYYVVTNQRILIVRRFFRKTMTSRFIADIPSLTLKQHRGNRGTILFENDSPPQYYSRGSSHMGLTNHAFHDIPEAEDVYRGIEWLRMDNRIRIHHLYDAYIADDPQEWMELKR